MHKKYFFAGSAVIALAVFAFILLNVTAGGFLKELDFVIDAKVLALQDPLLTSLALKVGYATNTSHIYLFTTVLIGGLIYYNKRLLALLSMCFLLINTASFSFIKAQTAILRPETIFSSETTFAFPSGHTATAFFFFGLLWYLLYTYGGPQIKHLVLPCITLIPFIVGISRMYSHAHWFSDVIGGACHGLFWLCCMLFLASLTKKE